MFPKLFHIYSIIFILKLTKNQENFTNWQFVHFSMTPSFSAVLMLVAILFYLPHMEYEGSIG
jgi:hypothetical protein